MRRRDVLLGIAHFGLRFLARLKLFGAAACGTASTWGLRPIRLAVLPPSVFRCSFDPRPDFRQRCLRGKRPFHCPAFASSSVGSVDEPFGETLPEAAVLGQPLARLLEWQRNQVALAYTPFAPLCEQPGTFQDAQVFGNRWRRHG